LGQYTCERPRRPKQQEEIKPLNSSNIDRTNSIRRCRVPRALFVIAGALAAFTSASGSPDFAKVIAVNFRPGGTNFDLTVSIPKGLHGASRTGGDFDVRVTLTYLSATNTVETIQFGRIPIRTGTSFIGTIDDRTAAIGLVLPLGTHPAPANDFSPTATAKVLRAAPWRDNWWRYF
jgi:hypothetical protein